MHGNPYEPGIGSDDAPETPPTRWLILTGGGAFVLGSLCLLAELFLTMRQASLVLPASVPKAIDETTYVNLFAISFYPLMAAAVLCVLGFALVLAGLIWREPVK